MDYAGVLAAASSQPWPHAASDPARPTYTSMSSDSKRKLLEIAGRIVWLWTAGRRLWELPECPLIPSPKNALIRDVSEALHNPTTPWTPASHDRGAGGRGLVPLDGSS